MKGADPYGASKAIRPWDGTSLSGVEKIKMQKGRKPTHEYFQSVRGCLSCTRPASACEECTGPKYAKEESRKEKRRNEIIKELKSGKSAAQVAKERGEKTNTILYYLKRYKDEIVDPCTKCRTKSICKAMGKPCTVKERWEKG